MLDSDVLKNVVEELKSNRPLVENQLKILLRFMIMKLRSE